MTRLLFTFLFIFLMQAAIAQTKPGVAKHTLDNVCDAFMKNFKDGNYDGAIQLLKDNSVISHPGLDTLANTIKQQMEYVIPGYGQPQSYVFVGEKSIKDILVKRVYILKLVRYYLRFNFVLYNNGTSWTITNFRYNEEIDDLF